MNSIERPALCHETDIPCGDDVLDLFRVFHGQLASLSPGDLEEQKLLLQAELGRLEAELINHQRAFKRVLCDLLGEQECQIFLRLAAQQTQLCAGC